jgi:glyoxylase-like metal-dependent hydrolase (beta-lactamase superfamily II)
MEALMAHLTRRDLVCSAAVATVVFGLGRPVRFVGSACAQDAGAAVKPFHTFKVGELEVTTIYDGVWQKPHDPGFIRNATVEETTAALKAAGYSGENVPIPFTVTVVRSGGRTIMFDAGTGAQLAPTAGKLAENMKAAGVDAAKIDTIVVTHFHRDHIFGLMAKDTNAQIYPDADIVVPAQEMAWWTDPGVFTKLPEARHGLAKRIQATLPTWKNVRTVEGEKEVAPGVRMVPAFGHTPGHTVCHLASGKDQLLVLADTSNMPALFVRNPGWHAAFDGDPQLAEANRRKLFDRAIADNIIVTGYHFGMPGAGRLAKDGSGYTFTPLA